MQRITLRAPYLIFLGDEQRRTYGKTGQGIVDWRRERCAGQLRLSRDALDLGLPEMTVEEAAAAGAGSLVVGTALVGGSIPSAWKATLLAAVRAGLDVVAGLHTRLDADPELVATARAAKVQLIDVRTPPSDLPVGTGTKRPGQRLLTVGTDCALGKKYTALKLTEDLRAAGVDATFRASGQTGIMIAGEGIPIDCVVADFISGAAELLSPANGPAHWDVIEGQGSLFHPGYGAVSHGLLVGSQPDAFVVCHAAGRTHVEGWPHVALPTIAALIERTIAIGSLTNPAIRCVGISIDTTALPRADRMGYLGRLSREHGLPCVDPMIDGTAAIVAALLGAP